MYYNPRRHERATEPQIEKLADVHMQGIQTINGKFHFNIL